MKAILYAAKSTEDTHGSIPTQLADARALVEREGAEVVAEYFDEAASAWSGNRGPQLEAALAHAEKIAPCWLAVQHTDRLARGDGKTGRHLIEVVLWAGKAGVQIRSVQDDSTGENLVMAVVMGMRNNEDSTRKSEAVKSGMRRGAEAGRPPGGPHPYGYRYGDNGAGLEIVPAEAEIVRRIFREYAAGRSLTALARELEAESIPTLRGGPWRQSTVSGIVGNPIFKGMVRHGKETFPGLHKAIIEPDLWERANTLRKSKPSKGRGRPPRGPHLFRGGFLRCSCGGAMVPRTRDGYQLYYCDNRAKLGKDFCSMPSPRRALIDTAVFDYFASVGLDIEATRKQVEANLSHKLSEVRALREDAEGEAQRAAERLSRVRRDYSDGKITAEDWKGFQEELTTERDAADASVKTLRRSESEIARGGELIDAEQETMQNLAAIRKAVAGEVGTEGDKGGQDGTRAALSRLFDRFILHPAGKTDWGRQHRDDPIPEGPAIAPLIDTAEFIIEVHLREEVLLGFEGLTPILTREPLEQAGNNQRNGLPCR